MLYFRAIMGIVVAAILSPSTWALQWEADSAALVAYPGVDTLTASFAFKNEGAAAVSIVNVSTDCLCTVAEAATSTIPPGATSAVRVRYSVGYATGHQEKKIKVLTSEGRGTEYVLKLRVEVEEPFKLEPAFVNWSKDDARAEKTVFVAVHERIDAAVVQVEPTSATMVTTLREISPKRYELRIRPGATTQRTTEKIRLRTNYPKEAPAVLTVYVTVQ